MYDFLREVNSNKSFMEVFEENNKSFLYQEKKILTDKCRFKIKYTIGEFTEILLDLDLIDKTKIGNWLENLVFSSTTPPKVKDDILNMVKNCVSCRFRFSLKKDALERIDTNLFPLKEFENLKKVKVNEDEILFNINYYNFMTFMFDEKE